jgi:hypothetical protein
MKLTDMYESYQLDNSVERRSACKRPIAEVEDSCFYDIGYKWFFNYLDGIGIHVK